MQPEGRSLHPRQTLGARGGIRSSSLALLFCFGKVLLPLYVAISGCSCTLASLDVCLHHHQLRPSDKQHTLRARGSIASGRDPWLLSLERKANDGPACTLAARWQGGDGSPASYCRPSSLITPTPAHGVESTHRPTAQLPARAMGIYLVPRSRSACLIACAREGSGRTYARHGHATGTGWAAETLDGR